MNNNNGDNSFMETMAGVPQANGEGSLMQQLVLSVISGNSGPVIAPPTTSILGNTVRTWKQESANRQTESVNESIRLKLDPIRMMLDLDHQHKMNGYAQEEAKHGARRTGSLADIDKTQAEQQELNLRLAKAEVQGQDFVDFNALDNETKGKLAAVLAAMGII